MTSNSNNAPLPYGWVQEQDQQSGHTFFVDTKANPPRSIWTHPYEDQQFMREHPELREKMQGGSQSKTNFAPPSSPAPQRRNSYNGKGAERAPTGTKEKKGFMSKLMDKAADHQEKKRQQMLAQQQMYAAQQSRYGGNQYYASPQYAYSQGGMMGPGMGGGMMGGGMGRMGGMGGGMGGMGGRGGGMGGMALPLVGGLAGGLLLGDMLDNDNNGGYGGGDYGGGGGDYGGGGDFGGGGGDFDGGGF